MLLARCTQFWQQALHIIQHDTLLHWHRELFRLYWRYKSRQKNRECLDYMLILHCLQLHCLVREYVEYYSQARPHQGIQQQIPDWYEQGYPLATGPIIATPVLNGLHHDYSRAAYLH